MPDLAELRRTDIGGGGAPGRRLTAQRGAVVAALLAAALASAPMPARAASVLSNGGATPTSGTTATAFAFSVDYTSSGQPVRNATAVWADVGGVTVPLALVAGGNTHDGTWAGSSTLPVGTWQVTFHATIAADPQPAPLDGPILTVTQAPTPPPTPTPSPTPRPTATPRPTPVPTSTPRTTSPPGTTPPPNVPGPQPTAPPSLGTGRTDTSDGSATPSPRESALAATAGPRASATPDADEAPAETPEPSPAAAEASGPPRGSLLAPLLFVGGTMSLVGAAVLGRQWYMTRKP